MLRSKIVLLALLSTAMGTFCGSAEDMASGSDRKLPAKRRVLPPVPPTKGAVEQKPFSGRAFMSGPNSVEVSQQSTDEDSEGVVHGRTVHLQSMANKVSVRE
jgi:hypothetical protein